MSILERRRLKELQNVKRLFQEYGLWRFGEPGFLLGERCKAETCDAAALNLSPRIIRDNELETARTEIWLKITELPDKASLIDVGVTPTVMDSSGRLITTGETLRDYLLAVAGFDLTIIQAVILVHYSRKHGQLADKITVRPIRPRGSLASLLRP